MATIKPTTVPAKRLSETISGSAASFKVNNLLSWAGLNDGSTLISASDFGTRLWVVFRNSAGTLMEIMEVDPATITVATSAITIIARGLKFDGEDATQVSANKLTWVKGDTIVEFGTHVPQLLAQYVDKIQSQTIGGVKTFSSLPATTAGNPVAANDLARKAYVDAVVAGIATAVSEVVPGTAGETLVAGNLIYLKLADNRWWKCDADTASTVDNVLLGVAQGAGTAGVAITNGIMLRGVDANQTGLVAGEVQYASNTAGGISNTPGTTEVTVGVAKSATELYFDPRFNQQITEDQQDALVGTSGIPSATNKYVTNADTSGSGAVVRTSLLNPVVDVQTFSTPGATSWTKPTGAKWVEVTVIGAGAGGTCAGGSSATNGGGGGYGFKRFKATALGTTENLIVGAGGAGTTGATSTAGGATSFGTTVLLKANGGLSGVTGTNGVGGAKGNGDIAYAGGNGGVDTATDPSPRGGAGSFITNYVKACGAAGNPGANATATDAGLLYGGVGGGIGNVAAAAGGNGGFPGGGGGAGGGNGTGAGGNGADGMVVIVSYF